MTSEPPNLGKWRWGVWLWLANNYIKNEILIKNFESIILNPFKNLLIKFVFICNCFLAIVKCVPFNSLILAYCYTYLLGFPCQLNTSLNIMKCPKWAKTPYQTMSRWETCKDNSCRCFAKIVNFRRSRVLFSCGGLIQAFKATRLDEIVLDGLRKANK